MRYRLILAGVCALHATFAAAQSCPPAPDVTDAVAAVLQDIRAAGSEMDARGISPRLWALWTKAPDARAQALLDEGLARLRVSDFETAYATLTELTQYCPDYAEGYNQRAFVSYLTQRFEPALADLNQALALSPNHTAAMSGKVLTLIGLGRAEAAQAVLRKALALDPWIPERRLLVEPAGEDL